jgi:hypothetical protein
MLDLTLEDNDKTKNSNQNMKKITLFILLSLCITFAYATEIDYQRSDSIKVMNLLSKARKQGKNTNMMIFFARQLRGLPYVAKTLENNKTEKLVINLRQLDCTTYVENVVALSLCMQNRKYTFTDFCRFLQRIRYKNGEIGYPTRLHYYSFWIADNTRKGYVKEVQTPNPPFLCTQKIGVNYMTTHVNQYPMLVNNKPWIQKIAEMEKSLNGTTKKYIPTSEIKNTQLLRTTIHNGDIIALVTSKQGLDISHLGIAVWHNDGLHMLNASMIRGKVVEEQRTLYKYMLKHPTNLGLRIIRLN